MSKFQRAVFSKTGASVFAVFAALAPLFFYACRGNQHVFLDNALFPVFSQTLFWLIAANAVGSTQVYEPYAYGSRSGRTIVSAEYAFTPCDGETQTWLCVSDWHTRNDLAKQAISHLGGYDGVILLGDASPDKHTPRLQIGVQR